ncbi:MAG: PqqD family protein [Clostridia bacterium]|nr:PqqD family protein [Clostridia bacterium]
MKIKNGYVLRRVADSAVVVAVGDEIVNFGGMINLNDTGAFLWERLEAGADKNELLEAMLKEYDVTEDVASEGIEQFLNKLREAGLIEE